VEGACVTGGNVGGIRHQIEGGVNGFLVDDLDEASERIVQLLSDPALRARLGRRARQTVRERFLVTRLMEECLDLIGSFHATYGLHAR
jgi:trehalose synthase